MRFIRQSFALIFALVAALSQDASAHSVGQLQTTKYFHPDTVNMLVNRAMNGGLPGFRVGDTISYIIEFTPVANGSNIGVQGYVTDYIPNGVDVVQASIVQKDGMGNFVDVPPGLPGLSYDGYGGRSGGFATFNAPFNVGTAYTAGCTAYPGNNCNARSCELQADTGIFYSTDARTAQFPAMPIRIVQGVAGNGYNINPSRSTQLNPLIPQTVATTHNLWDADQANGFGSTTANVTALVAPKSAQTNLLASRPGNTPFNAGSPVAGPQTGYQLDNTAMVGPWQRVQYAGSRMGDASRGPATAMGAAAGTVCGFNTSIGWALSSSNPLPSGTNAVRWALGKLQVGEIKYVKVSLKMTSPMPPSGIVNASEVFGADTANDDPSAVAIATGDNAWLYHIPSVADNNSNLLVQKQVIGYFAPATPTVLTPSDGSNIPMNAKVRYRVVYLNSGNANQTNVVLSDTLPCQTPANSVSNINVVSGSIGVGMPLPVLTAGTVATTCAAAGRRTFSFTPTVAALGPGLGGNIEYDVQLSGMVAGTLYNVPNTVKLVSTQIAAGVTSISNAAVSAVASPNLIISKTTSTPSVTAGGVATYTITVTNTGTAAAGTINVYDFLPTTGGVNNVLTRFSYGAAGSTTGLTAVVPVVAVPPTLTPYNTGGVSTNQQQVRWNFGAQTLAVGASMSITYTASVGASVPASATPYYGTAAVTYVGGVARDDAVNAAPVTVNSTLAATASIVSYWNAATATWVPYTNFVPPNAKIRYQIDYTNTGASPVTGANISNLLPCQTAANPVSNIVIVSGPIAAPAVNPPTVAAGNCTTGVRSAFSFTAGAIAAGQSGSIAFDVQTNAINGNTVVDTVTLSGTGAAAVTSEVQTSVQSTPMITVSKSTDVTGVKPNGAVNYTLTVTNTGTANVTNLAVYDWLPAGGAALNAATRFNFTAGSSVFGGSITGVVPTVVTPPAKVPYNTDVNAANMQELAWSFIGQTLAPGASFTITYTATAGASIPLGVYTSYGRGYRTQSAVTGTVTGTLGSVTVTGAGTTFTTQLAVGSEISIGGVYYTVATIASNTSLTLTKPYAGATAGGLLVTKAAQANSNTSSVQVSNAVADVGITLTNGVTGLVSGGTTTYTIVVTNYGPDAANGTKVYDSVAAGLSKTGVSCAASAGASCPLFPTVGDIEGAGVNLPSLPSGGSVTLTVTANVTATGGTVTNNAYIGLPAGVSDGNWNNDNVSDTDTIISSSLATSTKTWVDTNGGAHDAGDVITYTITLTESGGVDAMGVSVTDVLSAYLNNLVVDSMPVGASDNSSATTLDISNITVPANGSATIVFSTTIAAATPVGALVSNTATVSNPTGAGGAPTATSFTVGTAAASGMKALYLYGSDAATGLAACAAATPCKMSRVVTPNAAQSNTAVTIGRGSVFTWNLTPVLQSAVTLSPTISATVPVTLNLSTTNTRTYNVLVELYCSSAVPVAPAPISQTQAIALTNGTASAAYTFNLPLAAATTCAAGSSWVLRVTNSGGVNATRTVIVTPVSAALPASKVMLPSQNVINVASVATYDTAYPAVTTAASYASGLPVYLRAVVSDPFGSFDITSASVTVTDSNGVVQLTGGVMTAVQDSGAATKTFEYAFTIPVGAAGGLWSFAVTAKEGTENTVSHTRSGGFNILPPIDHYEIAMAADSISCLSTTVTVKACLNNSDPCTSVATTINGNVVLTTDAGTLALTTVPLTSGVGATTLSYPLAVDGATATVSLTSGDFTNTASCMGGTGCTTTFNTAGFIISDTAGGVVDATIPTQLAGLSAGTRYLRAVKKNDNSPQTCAAALQSTTTPVDFAYECNDPTTCSGSDLLSVNGGTATTVARNDNGGVPGLFASYSPVDMTFDANGNAPFSFVFTDVGMLTLHMKKSGVGGTTLEGASNSFVVKPGRLVLSAIQQTAAPNLANPAALNAAGAKFVKAGEPFSVTVTATGVDGVTATPNYGKEVLPEGAKLNHGLLTGLGLSTAGTLSGTFTSSFTNGVATDTAFDWSEVGIIRLAASIKDADGYLGSGDVGVSGDIAAASSSLTVDSVVGITVGDTLMVMGAGKAGSNHVAQVTGVAGLTLTLDAAAETTVVAAAVYFSSGNVGRFYPSHFQTTVSAPLNCTGLAFTTACPGNGLVYSGQAFITTVVAMNASAIPAQTLNYAYSATAANNFAKQVTLSDVAASGGGANGAGALTAGTTMADSKFTLGSGTLNTPVFAFTATPTAPTDVFVRAEDVETSSLRTVAADSVEGGLKVVSGRIRVSNAHGSEQLALPMTATVQYYVGPGWTRSSTDDVTSFSTATDIGATVIKDKPPGSCVVSVSNPGTVNADKGVFSFKLAKTNVTCSADISINAPTYLPSVPGRATFGVYRGNNEFIYLREAY